jgi:hypothetical protein
MVWLNDQHFNSKFPNDGVMRFGGAMCTCKDCQQERLKEKMNDYTLEQFKKDRNDAMLSKDKQTIVTFMKQYDIPIPRDDIFWITVHKTITAIPTLPIDFRRLSKAYLREAGFSSMDDGDL